MKRTLRGVTLYYNESNPGVRAVKLCIAALRVIIKYSNIKQYKGVNFRVTRLEKEEKPLNTLPTLDDNGFTVVDSIAIMNYLIELYGKRDRQSLFPKEVKKRAVVQRRLEHFIKYYVPTANHIHEKIFLLHKSSLSSFDLNLVRKRLAELDNVLKKTKYIAFDHITVADFSYISLVSTWRVMDLMPDFNNYPYLLQWMKRCEDFMPQYHEIMDKELATLKEEWSLKLNQTEQSQAGPMKGFPKPYPDHLF